MSGVMMMIIAIVVLGGAYLLYGRYLQNKWGIDPNAKTPAYEMEDRCGSDQWSDPGGNFWLASGPALDFNWRRIFRRRSGFCIHVCVCQK